MASSCRGQVYLDAAYTYDTEGKMTSVTYPTAYYLDKNGVTLDPVTGPTYTYSFDSMHRPVGLTDQNNNAAVRAVWRRHQFPAECDHVDELLRRDREPLLQ